MAANNKLRGEAMKPKDTAASLVLIFGSIAAFLLVVFGVGQLLGLFWHGPSAAVCDGRVMSKDETCEVFIEGAHAYYTYDQQLHEQWLEHDVYIYGASLVIVSVLTYAAIRYVYSRPVRSLRKKR